MVIARCYKAGMIITHPNRPDWGPGRVLTVKGDAVTVYFRDLPVTTAADATKTIRVRVVHMVPATSQHDPWLEAIPPLRDGVLRLPKPHATPGQALKGFLAHFAKGCRNSNYLTSERGPAWSAHESLHASLGDGQGEAMLAEGRVSDVLEKLRAAKRTANLLSPADRTVVAALLADSEGVLGYLRALFDATRPSEPAANHVKELLSHRWAVSGGLRPDAAWAAVTLFPFLARPDRFMFLRADAVPKAAGRLGFDIRYAAEPNWATYQHVLALGAAIIELLASVAGRDYIDAFALTRSVSAMTSKSLEPHSV